MEQCVYSPGCEVVLLSGVEARVLSVQLRLGAVAYEVSWWEGPERYSSWIEAHEIDAQRTATPKSRVGFFPGVP